MCPGTGGATPALMRATKLLVMGWILVATGCVGSATSSGDAGAGRSRTSSTLTGTFPTTGNECSCDTGGLTAVCTGTTTFTAAAWTSAATELLSACQMGADASVADPTYTCVYGVCGAPCGYSSLCSAPVPSAATSNAPATGTDTAAATSTEGDAKAPCPANPYCVVGGFTYDANGCAVGCASPQPGH